jgi:hypothetical protein
MTDFRRPNPDDSMTDHAEQHDYAYDEIRKSQVDIAALKVKLEDLSQLKTSGSWVETRESPPTAGKVYLEVDGEEKFEDVVKIHIHEKDIRGWSFDHSSWEPGDYISVIEHDVDYQIEKSGEAPDLTPDTETGHFGLYIIEEVVEGDPDTLDDDYVVVTPVSAFGDTLAGDLVEIEVLHAQEDINIGQLDDRYDERYAAHEHLHNYAEKTHTHSYADATHSHNYSDTNHAHDEYAPKGNYASTSHKHDSDYASSNHSHSSVPSHSHSYASSSHTHSYASTSHTHSYASTNHTHSKAKMQTGTSSNPSLTSGEMYLNTSQKVVYVGV